MKILTVIKKKKKPEQQVHSSWGAGTACRQRAHIVLQMARHLEERARTGSSSMTPAAVSA